MRFLLIESPRLDSAQLSAFDTGDIILQNHPKPELTDVLDFMEQHPDYFPRNRIGFWEFVTCEVLPPERCIYRDAQRKDAGARFLEVYALEEDEPMWDRIRCLDQNELTRVRAERPLYALVPLRREKPELRVVSG